MPVDALGALLHAVEEEIPVRTQYNSCGIGWETLWELRVELGGIFVGPCSVYL